MPWQGKNWWVVPRSVPARYAEQPAAADAFQRPLRSRFQARLSRSVWWPARRVVGGALYPRAVVGLAAGAAGDTCQASVAGWRSPGALGAGRRTQRRTAFPPPNLALEPTAPSGSFFPCVRRCLGGRLTAGLWPPLLQPRKPPLPKYNITR